MSADERGDVPQDAADQAAVAREPREERPGDSWIVALLFAILFGFDTYEAIINLQQLPMLYLGIESQIPWWLLVAAVAAPPLLFAGALAIGRRMRLVPKAGVLLVALGVSAQLSLLAEQLAGQITLAALGG
ncbi:hypothetical protein [Agrococcus carbonis]|uniref:Uncharacterized protein n=1 Tax=Agrococcus carbonis TaxID=684552 RepID=A0A1H1LVV2_9MICO|nr:hypothetical protein [Agrococcus carbonis]SDR78643.1 hypothetical protein SAMN04489719_0768 [Agrococcus carbonis]